MAANWPPGAVYLGNQKCCFKVWAPFAARVSVHVVEPEERLIPLKKEYRGYFAGTIDGVEPGAQYFYLLDGEKERPDPASRYQPRDVYGPSQVTDPYFPWDDSCWFGIPLRDYIIYEVHTGAFTPEGTFEAIIPYLAGLKELGITALELMPVAQFPGNRNWGYDGVYPFAVQTSYGGPDGLKTLVNACHLKGLAVILDVVYNHLGPEGNYLSDFGPYFTKRYVTPWGMALNFDGPDSDEVRGFFIQNALYWVTEFHVDALRLDAVHAILDSSPLPFLEELGCRVHDRAQVLNRQMFVIPESAANDSRLIRSLDLGGYGLDAQWNDDFHHAVHVLLTGEKTGYYEDYGPVSQLVKAFREGYVYSGEYSSYRRRKHGTSSADIPASRFVVFIQNHDQVGNRLLGNRLSTIISFEALKLAAGLLLLSPYVPLLFMGEEYGETAPFQYFVSHLDPELAETVRRGRSEEFAAFKWAGEPADPQHEATFKAAKLDHRLPRKGNHKALRELYRELIRLRKALPSLNSMSKECLNIQGYEKTRTIVLHRWQHGQETTALFHLGKVSANLTLPFPPGEWTKVLDSADKGWLGPGSTVPQMLISDGDISLDVTPESFVLFTN